MNAMHIHFPGGARVDANYKGFTIPTDQPASAGGEGAAPAPFDLFLASIGTCAGVYLLDFLRKRGLPVEGAGLTLQAEKDPVTKRVSRIVLGVTLPAEFPRKYEAAVARAIGLCTVKQHLEHAPEFETRIEFETPVAVG